MRMRIKVGETRHFHEENKMSSPAATSSSTSSASSPAATTATVAATRLQVPAPSAATSASPISASIALQTIAAPSTSPRRASAPQASLLHHATTTPSSKRRRTDPAPKAGIGYNIGLIGCGNMARALVEGMLASGQVLSGTIMASATRENSENLKKMKALGVSTTTHNRDVILNSDIIVLAVKPYQILSIMSEIQSMFSDFQSRAQPHVAGPKSWRPLIVSVASSVTIADIEQKTEISWNMGVSSVSGHLPIIRSLPTIASSVRAGITAYCRGKFCNEADVKPFLLLFSMCGHVEEVPEKYLDAITSVSGSGLAFAAVGLEGMADGAVLSGIPRQMALKFSAYAIMSAARLVLEKGISPADIKDSVCSPGGTTIYGIQKMEAKGTRGAYMDAVLAATERATQLKPK